MSQRTRLIRPYLAKLDKSQVEWPEDRRTLQRRHESNWEMFMDLNTRDIYEDAVIPARKCAA